MHRFYSSQPQPVSATAEPLPPFSIIDVEYVKKYLKIDWADDDQELELFLSAAKSYVYRVTGTAEKDLDYIDLSTIVVLKMVSDFYHNRTTSATDFKVKLDPLFVELINTIRTYTL